MGESKAKEESGPALQEPADAQPVALASDVEKAARQESEPTVDIEHVEVEDDPRTWPASKKYFNYFFVCWSAMAAAMSANIYFPAIDDLQRDLKASQQVINLSVSLFILVQGNIPLIWSAISEIYGRKIVYLIAYSIFTISQIACALSTNQAMFLVFRVLGAAGSSAGLTIGGGTLADMYDTHERGTRIGIYYLFPLLGPSLGTLLGGALTLTKPGWRAAFWFMVAYGASCLVWAIFFLDTFRKERSLAWTRAYKRAEAAAKAKDEARRNEANSPISHRRLPWSKSGTKSPRSATPTPPDIISGSTHPEMPRQLTGSKPLRKVTTETGEEVPIKIHLADINPLSAAGLVMRQPANLLAIVASGLLFGGQYSLTYTGALSFAAPPYNFNALKVGLVLLCFGVGNIIGSIGGGRYSDIILRRLKQKNGGKGVPEFRLRATLMAMPLVPLSFLAYAWTVDKGVNVAGPCVVLFIAGLSSIWVYSATLAYIVDASVGMASSAISCNSSARGTFGFIASEIGQPLLDSVGNGWLYTIWTIIESLALVALVIVCWKGQSWRARAEERKAAAHLEKLEGQ